MAMTWQKCVVEFGTEELSGFAGGHFKKSNAKKYNVKEKLTKALNR